MLAECRGGRMRSVRVGGLPAGAAVVGVGCIDLRKARALRRRRCGRRRAHSPPEPCHPRSPQPAASQRALCPDLLAPRNTSRPHVTRDNIPTISRQTALTGIDLVSSLHYSY